MKHRILPGLLSTALTLSLCALPASALETEDTRMLLETYYVDEIPQEILNLDSTEAILEALNDPYTVYMSAEEYQAFLNQVDGETVVGIGVSIQNAVDDGVQILSILDNSPAQEAGLSAGDRILAVDGVPLTAGMDPSTLISELRVSEARKLMNEGVIGGGMLPKLNSCIDAIEHGVSRVHILDGRIPHCLLLEIFTNKGIGTAILNEGEQQYYYGE